MDTVHGVESDGHVGEPELSIVLPTYRRPERLSLLLDGLRTQDPPRPTELIVIDNDPEGTAAPVVTAHAADLPMDVIYEIEDRSGASFARNRGVAAARGPILVLIDDDVIPQQDWLPSLVAPLFAEEADVTGGRVVLDPDVPRPDWFDESGIGGYLTNFDLGPEPRPLYDGEILVTANLALRTELVRRVGGFDTGLGPRGAKQLVSDDVQLLRAVQAIGAHARWVPGAVVIHELPQSRLRPLWILERAWLQGRSDWIAERRELERRRWNGTRIAVEWLWSEFRVRVGEGLLKSRVAFHLLCDVVRTAGRLSEAVAWAMRERVRRPPDR